MTAKMEVVPSPAPANTFVQVRASGLAKGKSYLLTATPPTGPEDERIAISDSEGMASESFFTYAQGEWAFRLDLQREGDPNAEATLDVQ